MFEISDIETEIFKLCSFKTKINLKMSSLIFNRCEIDLIPKKYSYLLSDKIIKNMKLHVLNAYDNSRITDERIKI